MVVTSSDGEYQLLTVKPTGYGKKNPIVQVWYTVENVHISLNVMVHANVRISFKKAVHAGEWYHVIIQRNAGSSQNELSTFVNMEKLQPSKESVVTTDQDDISSVEILLGKSIDKKIDKPFQMAEISIDNFAIWERYLDAADREKIYLIELGRIEKMDISTDGELPKIIWTRINDSYSQTKAYVIEWWTPNSAAQTKLIYPAGSNGDEKTLNASLEIFEPNVEYNVRLIADLVGNVKLEKEGKFQMSSSKKGSEVDVYSDSPGSITISWKVGVKNPKLSSFVITYNNSASGDVKKMLNTESLDYKLTGLKPFTIYSITITRQDKENPYQVQFIKSVQTMSVVESLDSSIRGANITSFTKNSVKMIFFLYPDLVKYYDIDYKLEYLISIKELYNSSMPARETVWNRAAEIVTLQFDRLNATTTYLIDVALKEEGYNGDVLKMKTPFIFRIKDFYKPPSKIELLNSTENSLTLELSFPKSVIENKITISKVEIFISSPKEHKISLNIDDAKKVNITKLDQYTVYNISAATGDGVIYGKRSDDFVFKTSDKNECSHHDVCGSNMQCLNTPGSFICSCLEGYAINGDSCDDIDECLKKDICGENTICSNTLGSYTCRCEAGFQMRNGSCHDVDECSKKDVCGENMNCSNSYGSFACSCKNGFKMSNGSCHDVDECSREDICGENMLCTNNHGSYVCSCQSGFKMVNGTCHDVDECASNDVCGENMLCTNNHGSYNCSCLPGFKMINGSCDDVDECSSNDVCGENMFCTNNHGSFVCSCLVGFKIVDGACHDVDECSLKDVCGAHMVCSNTLGSYSCSCMSGFQMINDSCHDVNECALVGVCSPHAERKICVNDIGSYYCQCREGYEKKDVDCIDINECVTSDRCSNNSICNNTLGSFQCSCKTGFIKNEDKCVDVDECLQGDICIENSMCMNVPGSYHCKCIEGYVKIGQLCVEEASVVLPCPAEEYRKISWPEVHNVELIFTSCPPGTSGQASRECLLSSDGNFRWEDPDLSSCVSDDWKDKFGLQAQGNLSEVASNLKEFVSEKSLYGGDVKNVVGMIDLLVKGKKTINSDFTEVVIGVTSSLLDSKVSDAWKDLPKLKRTNEASQLLHSSENLVESQASASAESEDKPKAVITENVEMKLQKVSAQKKLQLYSETTGNSVALPEGVIDPGDTPAIAAVVSYKGLGNLIGVPRNSLVQGNSSTSVMNSEMMSFSLYPETKLKFSKPVIIVHEILKVINNTQPNCVFWDTDEKRWSNVGCVVAASNKTHVTCHCNHLTSFAILMSAVDVHSNLTEPHRLALGLITTIGISVSLFGLVASLLTFIFVRAIRSIRNTIHRHLVVALFIAQIVFLFGIERTEWKIGCQVIAAVLHYFFLVSFFIMGLEGMVLYFMLVRVYRSLGTSGYGSVKYVVWCWVMPIIFIVINLIINDGAYNSHSEYCWLTLRNGYIWSFVGPVLLIIALNFFILCMTLRVMTEKAKKRNSVADEIWFWMKGSCLLLCLLGVTWVLGIFFVDQKSIFMAYLFNIVNSLQGFSIFIFHCLCDPRVRKAYYHFFCCVPKRDQSLIRTATRSTRFSNASKSSVKTKKGTPKLQDRHEKSSSNGVPNHEVSLMSSPGPYSTTPNDSFGLLVGGTKL